jgi:gamma-glutamylcyclotransferase (GGCT)/AIG2-like uncharacterized protein YtfP
MRKGISWVIWATFVIFMYGCGASPQEPEGDPAPPSVQEGHVYHFGYGSNLSASFLKQYCPSLKFVTKAYLPNYRVEFRYYSENRQGGISSIMEAPGEMVHGVVYSMPTKEMDDLDVLESVPEGLYTRETFLVMGDGGHWLEADLYRVANPEGPFTPAKSYLDLMIEGAKEHHLDPEYIEKLVSLRGSLE